jgi:hypothetical protein
MSVRILPGVLSVLAAAVALAACGSDGADVGGSAAGVVPADVALYVSGTTDFDGEEWQRAEELVKRFPDGERALRELLADFESEEGLDFEQDVKPAFGPETAVVAFDLGESPAFVGLTQPQDPQKLEQLLETGDEPLVSAEVEGWTAFSDDQAALDRLTEAAGGESLADSEDYEKALGGLDAGVVSVYVRGEGLQRALEQDPSFDAQAAQSLLPEGELPAMGMTLGADEDGARFDGNFVFAGDLEDTALAIEPFDSDLVEEVPGGVLAFLSFNDLEQQFSQFRDALAQIEPELESQIGQAEAAIGLSLEEDIAPLFAGEGALYLRGGLPIPEITLVTRVEDEEQAVATLDDLVEGLQAFAPVAPPEETEIAGVEAREVALPPPAALYYAAFDGKLVVTTARDGIAALREGDERLEDDEAFSEALERADVPAETTGLAYVNLGELLPILFDYAELGGEEPVPPEVRANTEPLDTLVAYGTRDGDTLSFSAFLGVE